MRECNSQALKEKVMSRRILYIDPWSGVSGDMMLSALLDSDWQSGRLESVLRSSVDALGLDGTSIEVTRAVDHGLECTRVRVDDGEAAPLRRLKQMEQVISGAPLSWSVRERSLVAVRRLAEVEAGVHGCAVEEIHFHEIGAVDTLVDVVGTFALIEAMRIDAVHVGVIPVGGGTVEIAHGSMGVPAPATVRLLEGYPVIGGPEARELTTPTGALLVGQLGAVAGDMPSMLVEAVGYGGGTMSLESRPNVLRVVVGSAASKENDGDTVVELQTNLDDVSAEVIAHAMSALRDLGALDVWTVPAQMKKGRPGVVLHALVREADERPVVTKLFEETGTLGIRRALESRHVAERGIVTVEVAGSPIGVKWGRWADKLVSIAPEYEDSSKAAADTGLTLREVNRLATEAAAKILAGRASG
jgi:hypothetical protein